MVVYLNRGLALEEALVAELARYFADIRLDETYENFRVRVTNRHPFADIYFRGEGATGDAFPCVVVSTESGGAGTGMDSLIPQTSDVSIGAEEFDALMAEASSGAPGICAPMPGSAEKAMRERLAEKGFALGERTLMRRRDSMSIEIWADNDRLKNELYEQTRLFVMSGLDRAFARDYPSHDVSIDTSSARGSRSNNYNLDFDAPLSGAQISFGVDYSIEQSVFDTLADAPDGDLTLEVVNHVATKKS